MSTQWKDRISDDDSSRPTLRVSGVLVEAVLNALADGWSHERLLAAYPALSESDIRACITFAAESVRKLVVIREIRAGIKEADAGQLIPDEELDDYLARNRGQK